MGSNLQASSQYRPAAKLPMTHRCRVYRRWLKEALFPQPVDHCPRVLAQL